MSIAMRTIRLAAAATVLTLAAALVPSAAEAQTISACYTQKNGTMYRVGAANTPTNCTSTTHVKETWNIQGTPGISGYQILYVTLAYNDSNKHVVQAVCPAGKQLLGGGYQNRNGFGLNVIHSYPLTPTTWTVMAERVPGTSVEIKLTAYAICAKVAA